MAYTQEYVNQLIQEAATQAGGSLSYADVANAAANLGIPLSQVDAAMSAGAPVYEDVSSAPAAAPNVAVAAPSLGAQGIGLSDAWSIPGAENTHKKLTDQILSQGTTSQWSGEGWGSAEKNAEDMAKILTGIGITDLSQFGEIKQTVQGDPIYGGPGDDPVLLGYGPDKVITTYGNKVTGQAVPNTYSERQTGNAWGGTFAGDGNTGYRVQFDAQGNPFFYTTGASSNDLAGLLENPILNIAANAAAAYFGGPLGVGTLQLAKGGDLSDAAKAALLTYGAQQLSSGLNSTDLGMNSDLTMAQIESGLGTEGYGVGAQATQSGLFDPAMIGSGAYTQTSYPYDMSEFLAADVQNLYSQVGSNIPAIEQNLVASGVDPLVAADVANQITLNPNISTYDLTNYINTNFGGGSLYDVNMATQYPTSQLPGAGGLLSDLPGAGATTTTTGGGTSSGTGLTGTQIANLIRGGLALAGAGSAVSNMGGGGGGGVGGLPTQGVPTGNQDYYNAIQQYYNAYMPAAPRDVATPLQNWYNSKYGA